MMNKVGSGDASIGDEPSNIRLTVQIVSAFVANNSISQTGLDPLLKAVGAAIQAVAASGDGKSRARLKAARRPAVKVSQSVSDEWIVCLEDGLPFRTLTRHLSHKYGMTPEQYRVRWGLPGNYPMVAPSYARKRSAIAKVMGLGRHSRPEWISS